MKPDRCCAVAKSGKPCSATVVADGMCAWHAPSWDARRRAWSAEGGRQRSNKARAKKQLPNGVLTNTELLGTLGVTISKVLSGAVEPGIGSAIASLARAYITVTEAGALEDLTRRLDELERLAPRGGAA